MSLYGDLFEKDVNKVDSAQKPPNQNFLFLKQQLEAKKAQAAQNKLKVKPSTSAVKTGIGINPILPKPQNILKPRRVKPLPLDAPSTFSLLPTAKEEKINLFGEILIEDEYNPMNPTDYATFKPKREAQLAKERIAKEIADRLAKELKEEEKKRRSGAAFAPPQALIEQDAIVAEPEPVQPAPLVARGIKRGNVVANMMSRMGYVQGQGLGKDKQGIPSALRVEKVGRLAGMIVDGSKKSWDRDEQGKYVTQRNPKSTVELIQNPSKIVFIKNMILPSDVNESLNDEVQTEMLKYGQVTNVEVYTKENVEESDAVRIFVEFTNQAQSMKAVIDLNKRFFGGRPITAEFFDYDKYVNKDFSE